VGGMRPLRGLARAQDRYSVDGGPRLGRRAQPPGRATPSGLLGRLARPVNLLGGNRAAKGPRVLKGPCVAAGRAPPGCA